MPFEPNPVFATGVETTPLPEFYTWFHQVEQCSGIRGDFQRVRWFIVPGNSTRREKVAFGETDWPRHSIYLTEFSFPYKRTVAHEILHELLQRRNLKGGLDQHPVEYFGRRDSSGYHGGRCSDLLRASELTEIRHWCGNHFARLDGTDFICEP